MNTEHASPAPGLTLFVAGESPRSRRARHNLERVLQATGIDRDAIHEIDLLACPERIAAYGVFATPALMRVDGDSGEPALLYGDLSDDARLRDFLRDLPGAPD